MRIVRTDIPFNVTVVMTKIQLTTTKATSLTKYAREGYSIVTFPLEQFRRMIPPYVSIFTSQLGDASFYLNWAPQLRVGLSGA